MRVSVSTLYWLLALLPMLLSALMVTPLTGASVHSGYDSAISMIGSEDGEWSNTEASSRAPHRQSRCIDIPSNFTLCHGIQYRRMHLPNLLEHESIDEALEQSDAWNSLIRLHCHPDARLFLCSLFAPICLDDQPSSSPLPLRSSHQAAMKIEPCQSLCWAVKNGCEERMQQYGFPWPEILRCSKFPPDNDMCIRLPSEKPPPALSASINSDGNPLTRRPANAICKSCAQVPTFENLMDSYCRSTMVLKGRPRMVNSTHVLVTKRNRVFKGDPTAIDAGILLQLSPAAELCHCPEIERTSSSSNSKTNYLIMAGITKKGTKDIPSATLLVPWQANDKGFKSAVRRFRKLNCQTLGREVRESMMATGRQRPFRRTIF